jgi:hypothetical protein
LKSSILEALLHLFPKQIALFLISLRFFGSLFKRLPDRGMAEVESAPFIQVA